LADRLCQSTASTRKGRSDSCKASSSWRMRRRERGSVTDKNQVEIGIGFGSSLYAGVESTYLTVGYVLF